MGKFEFWLKVTLLWTAFGCVAFAMLAAAWQLMAPSSWRF